MPTVGRIVHYVPTEEHGNDNCHAAIITQVSGTEEDVVSLCVFAPSGVYHVDRTAYDSTLFGYGTWHWPERVL